MADKVNGLLDPTEQEMLSGLLGRMKPEELLRALQNTAQSASNMVAENVSAPVDGLAWLLKKAGVSVGDKPVMGSDWMRDKGLTIPVQEGASKVVGDTVGLLAPMGLTKAGAQAMMEVGGKMKNLPVGLSIKDVSAPQAEALRLAQQRAALPVEKGGLGLPANNTAAERAKAMGFEDEWMHGSPNPTIKSFDPSTSMKRGDDFGPATFATKSGDNASGYSLNWQEYASHPEKAAIEVKRQEILDRFLKAKQAGNEKSAASIRQELNTLRDGDELYSDFLNYKLPSDGSTVYPLMIQTEGMPLVSGGGRNFRSVHPTEIPKARNSGSSGVLISDVADNAGRFSGTSDVAAVFNPENIRSRFAAFDPYRKTAAIAALYGVAAPDLLAAEKEKPKKPRKSLLD